MHTVEASVPATVTSAASPGRARAAKAGVAIAGVVVVLIATMVLHDANGLLRAALVAAGLAAVAWVLDGVLRARRPWLRIDLALSAVWLLLIGLLALLADVLPLREGRVAAKALDEPVLARPDLFSAHPLGTDRHGLDLLSGIAFGARVSLVVGLGAAAIGLLIGGGTGLCAGYYRGRLDRLTSLITDSMLAFPPLILLLGLVAVVDASVTVVTAGLAVLAIPTFIRLARANTIAIADREFVVAAVALGARRRRILVRDILPNVLGPVLAYTVVVVAALIVAEASLSFLGLSVQRPSPTWGNMIAAGEASYDRHPHLVAVPSICLFFTVFALNRVGEQLQHLRGGVSRNR
jgi:peptide/nickel transport system permease protein